MKKITLLNEKTDASISDLHLKYDEEFMIDFGDYDDVKIKIICYMTFDVIFKKDCFNKKVIGVQNIIELIELEETNKPKVIKQMENYQTLIEFKEAIIKIGIYNISVYTYKENELSTLINLLVD
jgi:hypothetical protein